MLFENHFYEKQLPENADREQKSDVIAAKVLMRILEGVIKEFRSDANTRHIRVEGSCMTDLRMWAEGLGPTEVEMVKYRTGLTPQPFMRAEKSA